MMLQMLPRRCGCPEIYLKGTGISDNILLHVPNERAYGLAFGIRFRAVLLCADQPGFGADTALGVAMSLNQVGLPTRTKLDPSLREPLDFTARLECAPGRPRVVRMPSDWWDSPAVAACALATNAQSARAARRFTRDTLRDWGLSGFADDVEAIVGEFVANAISHAARGPGPHMQLGLRLLRRAGEVMCAVLDPSDSAPVLRKPSKTDEAGRGLQMVDALSDVWGWSPVTGRGKAVWAIVFCA